MKNRKINQSAGVVANVVDSLDSTSAIDALSANQGKILNEKIDNLEIPEATSIINELTSDSISSALSAAMGKQLNDNKLDRYKNTKTLSTTGWYRIAKYNSPGTFGKSFLLNVSTCYSYAVNESFLYAINLAYQKSSVDILSGKRYSESTVVIDAVRVVLEEDSIYIDIYYKQNVANQVMVSFLNADVHDSLKLEMIDFTPITGSVNVLDSAYPNNNIKTVCKVITDFHALENDEYPTGIYFVKYNNTAANIPDVVPGYALVHKETNNYIYITAWSQTSSLDVFTKAKYGSNAWQDWIPIGNRRQPAVTTDFNTLLAPGVYCYRAIPTGNNRPCDVTGVLEVFGVPASTIRTQRYTEYTGAKVYIRGCYDGSWSAWHTYSPS